MTGLGGAVESAAPVSRLHLHQSYDLSDFPVPSGREEEWRFTPLRRLRGAVLRPLLTPDSPGRFNPRCGGGQGD